MHRFVNSVLLLCFAFMVGAFSGVHCPVFNHYAGGRGTVKFIVRNACDCGCREGGECDCENCPCKCCKDKTK